MQEPQQIDLNLHLQQQQKIRTPKMKYPTAMLANKMTPKKTKIKHKIPAQLQLIITRTKTLC